MSFQECNNKLIIAELNLLGRSKKTTNGFNVQKSNLILIFEMTSEFNIQILKSVLHY